jgi:hypothetical protein
MTKPTAIAVAQIAVLFVTGYLLIATSQSPCTANAQVATFKVVGGCGPERIITVSSDTHCRVTLEGAAYLPSESGALMSRTGADGGSPTIDQGFSVSGISAEEDGGPSPKLLDAGQWTPVRSCTALPSSEGLELNCTTLYSSCGGGDAGPDCPTPSCTSSNRSGVGARG